MSNRFELSRLAVEYHPGSTLSEKLSEMGMGIKEFALRTSKPEKTIIAVINGSSSITTEMAVSFEIVTKIPASFWLRKQQAYDEYVERKNREKMAFASAEWLKKFPISEMVKRGWLCPTNCIGDKVQALFSFFAICSEKAWNDYYLNQELKIAFRISLAHTKDPHSMSVWLRRGEIQASNVSINIPYSEKRLKTFLPQMKQIMVDDTLDFFKDLQKICADCGIKLVSTECLPKAPIRGATRWINDVPVVQLSNSYERYDIFWFNFFHEIGHILLHGKKDIFLELSGGFEQDSIKEAAADLFAANILLSQSEERSIIECNDFSLESIQRAARIFRTHPSVIVGRLQHLKLIDCWKDQSWLKSVEIG